jgi:class 3 adenylate cyclase/tetratricopeptide (TPR) repeat protein
MNIAHWLRSLGLSDYTQAFIDNHIDEEILLSLTVEDLKDIGIASVGHRRRLMTAIEELKHAKEQATTSDDRRVVPDAVSERREVTVLFADIEGFTALSEMLDAEKIHSILSTFFEHIDGIINGLGGRIDKHIGDCAMAVFGAPVAHIDDVRRAVQAALLIHSAMDRISEAIGRRLRAHVGIASGEVVASATGSSRYQEYTVTGETVNRASRLTSLAKEGETIVSAEIVHILGDQVDAEPRGAQMVKGLKRSVEVWRVRGLSDMPATDARPLVGRRAELAQCMATLNSAREGNAGGVIFVRGEAGIGKSRLVQEVLKKAGEIGFAAYCATVFDFGAAIDRDPLRLLGMDLLSSDVLATGTLTDALARFVASEAISTSEVLSLKDLLGLEQRREERRQLDAMTPAARVAGRGEALGALALAKTRHQPVLIVVEDMHWAEETALGGLNALASLACNQSRTVLLLTSRIEGDPLAGAANFLSGLSLVVIELARLREHDARALAASFIEPDSPLLNLCIARAEGNPLFLEQLVRHASAGGPESSIPGSIRSVVLAQIDRLNVADKIAIQAAAVLGDQFTADALNHLIGRSSYQPDFLLKSRLIRPVREALQFSHALIRNGVYTSILHSERRRLHKRAADWFDGRDAVLKAEHLARAEDPAAIVAYRTAARELAAAYRLEAAADLIKRARAIASDRADRVALACEEGRLLLELGRATAAIACFDAALENAPDAYAAAAARLGKAGALRLIDRVDEALLLLSQAEPTFVASESHGEMAELEHLRGNLFFPKGQHEECRLAHQRALDHANKCGSIELRARALGGLGDAAYASGQLRTACHFFQQCVEIARQNALGRVEVANAAMLAATHAFSGTGRKVFHEAEAAISAAVAARQPRAELIAHHMAMIIHLWSARPNQVKPHFERAQEIVRAVGARRFEAENLAFMAEAYRQLGDRQQAIALLEEAAAISRETGISYFGAIVLGFQALASADRPALQRAVLEEGECLARRGYIAHNALFFGYCAIESCLLARNWNEARRFADFLAAAFEQEPVLFTEFLVERCQLLAQCGESDPSRFPLDAIRACWKKGMDLGYMFFVAALEAAHAEASGKPYP